PAGRDRGSPELQGLGPREIQAAPSDVEASLIAQIGALAAIGRAEGVMLRHVKAHGALYNMAARDRRLAEAIAHAIKAVDPALIMFGLPGSPMIEAGAAAGLPVAAEGFADPAHPPDGPPPPPPQPGPGLPRPAL